MTAPALLPPDPPRHPIRFCSEEKPRCPYGHRLRIAHRLSHDGTMRCTHRDPRSGQVCDTLCWMALISFGGSAVVRGTGERLWIVMQVSAADVRHFTNTPMTLLERIAYLGHAIDGVMLDLLGGLE